MPNRQNSLNQYKQVDVGAKINDASPHRLIQMLFERFLQEVSLAKTLIERKDFGKKAAHIAKAHSIVVGLQTSLETDSGYEISDNLEALYVYVGELLLEANTRNDADKLDEAAQLIGQIKSGWDGIRPESTADLPGTIRSGDLSVGV